MRPTLLALPALLLFGCANPRTTSSPLGLGALPVVAAPAFQGPLGPEWSTAKGTWAPADGILRMTELPAEKHVAVLHHVVPLPTAVIELDFKQAQAGAFYVGCDSTRHIGRVVVLGGAVVIQEDSGKTSRTVAKLDYTAKPGEWHHLRVEWSGDEMACVIDGRELRARDPYFATAKRRSWLAGARSAEIRDLTIAGRKPGE